MLCDACPVDRRRTACPSLHPDLKSCQCPENSDRIAFRALNPLHSTYLIPSCLVRARPAGLELAMLALENVPVRPGVAHVAMPQDQRRVGFDHLERMVATARHCHCGVPR